MGEWFEEVKEIIEEMEKEFIIEVVFVEVSNE